MSAETVFALAAICFGLHGLWRSRPQRPSAPRVCADCGAPYGSHHLHCVRVLLVIEANVAAFREQLDGWDGTLDEIRSGQ